MVLGAAAVVGSAGLAWAVGENPPARSVTETTVSPAKAPASSRTAPTPRPSGTGTPVVTAVPAPTVAGPATPVPTVAGGTTATSDPAPVPASTPKPERTKPGKGATPTARPTKSPR